MVGYQCRMIGFGARVTSLLYVIDNTGVTRILNMTHNWEELRTVASDIIEGHLRDAIATMTPEQVMQDKDTLVARLINVCIQNIKQNYEEQRNKLLLTVRKIVFSNS